MSEIVEWCESQLTSQITPHCQLAPKAYQVDSFLASINL